MEGRGIDPIRKPSAARRAAILPYNNRGYRPSADSQIVTMLYLPKLAMLLMLTATAFCHCPIALGQGKALIECYDHAQSRGEVTIQVNQQTVGQLRWTGSEKDLKVAPFSWPKDARQVNFQGQIDWVHYQRGKQHSLLSNIVPIIDLTELTEPLRNPELVWPKRLAAYQLAQASFLKKQPELAEELDLAIEPGDQASEAQISAAEKRLGFALPLEHKQTLQEFGNWGAEDSWTMRPEQLANAFDQMINVWETPAESMHSLPDATKKFLRSCVIVFTMSGDGYGALAYRPTLKGNADSDGEFYALHQDSINKPQLLKNHDGSNKTYSQAMLWLFAQEVLIRVDSLGLNVCFVDHGATDPLIYRLTHETEGRSQVVRLALQWESFQ